MAISGVPSSFELPEVDGVSRVAENPLRRTRSELEAVSLRLEVSSAPPKTPVEQSLRIVERL
jgi:hypothetical protein